MTLVLRLKVVLDMPCDKIANNFFVLIFNHVMINIFIKCVKSRNFTEFTGEEILDRRILSRKSVGL